MKTYSPEIKAQVIAEWLAGAPLRQLVKRHGIPKSTVQTWANANPRTAVVPEMDLREQFGRLVFQTAMHTFEALDAHVRAASTPAIAGTIEGWTTRVNELTKTAVALGAAIQRGSSEPITIPDADDV